HRDGRLAFPGSDIDYDLIRLRCGNQLLQRRMIAIPPLDFRAGGLNRLKSIPDVMPIKLFHERALNKGRSTPSPLWIRARAARQTRQSDPRFGRNEDSTIRIDWMWSINY